MAGIAIDYINSAIAKVNIPDIEGFLKFTYHLSQIKIEEFNISKSSNAFQISSLDKLGINLQGISGKMSAHYQIKIKEGFIHVSKLGTVDVTIGSTSVDAFVGILSPYVNPNISNSSCTANFGVFVIKFHGSLLDDIIELFRKEIEKHFKGKIKEVTCQKIENVKSDKGNKILWSFPLDVRLTRTFEGFHFDYALTSISESSTTSCNIPIEGHLYYEEHQNDPKIPKPNNVIHPYDTNKYLCINFDGDRVLDSAAYAFELSFLFHQYLW